MLPDKAKFTVCSIIKLATIALMRHLVIGQRQKAPKRTKAELITSYCSYARSAQPGPNRTRLCGPCIAAKAGLVLGFEVENR